MFTRYYFKGMLSTSGLLTSSFIEAQRFLSTGRVTSFIGYQSNATNVALRFVFRNALILRSGARFCISTESPIASLSSLTADKVDSETLQEQYDHYGELIITKKKHENKPKVHGSFTVYRKRALESGGNLSCYVKQLRADESTAERYQPALMTFLEVCSVHINEKTLNNYEKFGAGKEIDFLLICDQSEEKMNKTKQLLRNPRVHTPLDLLKISIIYYTFYDKYSAKKKQPKYHSYQCEIQKSDLLLIPPLTFLWVDRIFETCYESMKIGKEKTRAARASRKKATLTITEKAEFNKIMNNVVIHLTLVTEIISVVLANGFTGFTAQLTKRFGVFFVQHYEHLVHLLTSEDEDEEVHSDFFATVAHPSIVTKFTRAIAPYSQELYRMLFSVLLNGSGLKDPDISLDAIRDIASTFLKCSVPVEYIFASSFVSTLPPDKALVFVSCVTDYCSTNVNKILFPELNNDFCTSCEKLENEDEERMMKHPDEHRAKLVRAYFDETPRAHTKTPQITSGGALEVGDSGNVGDVHYSQIMPPIVDETVALFARNWILMTDNVTNVSGVTRLAVITPATRTQLMKELVLHGLRDHAVALAATHVAEMKFRMREQRNTFKDRGLKEYYLEVFNFLHEVQNKLNNVFTDIKNSCRCIVGSDGGEFRLTKGMINTVIRELKNLDERRRNIMGAVLGRYIIFISELNDLLIAECNEQAIMSGGPLQENIHSVFESLQPYTVHILGVCLSCHVSGDNYERISSLLIDCTQSTALFCEHEKCTLKDSSDERATQKHCELATRWLLGALRAVLNGVREVTIGSTLLISDKGALVKEDNIVKVLCTRSNLGEKDMTLPFTLSDNARHLLMRILTDGLLKPYIVLTSNVSDVSIFQKCSCLLKRCGNIIGGISASSLETSSSLGSPSGGIYSERNGMQVSDNNFEELGLIHSLMKSRIALLCEIKTLDMLALICELAEAERMTLRKEHASSRNVAFFSRTFGGCIERSIAKPGLLLWIYRLFQIPFIETYKNKFDTQLSYGDGNLGANAHHYHHDKHVSVLHVTTKEEYIKHRLSFIQTCFFLSEATTVYLMDPSIYDCIDEEEGAARPGQEMLTLVQERMPSLIFQAKTLIQTSHTWEESSRDVEVLQRTIQKIVGNGVLNPLIKNAILFLYRNPQSERAAVTVSVAKQALQDFLNISVTHRLNSIWEKTTKYQEEHSSKKEFSSLEEKLSVDVEDFYGGSEFFENPFALLTFIEDTSRALESVIQSHDNDIEHLSAVAEMRSLLRGQKEEVLTRLRPHLFSFDLYNISRNESTAALVITMEALSSLLESELDMILKRDTYPHITNCVKIYAEDLAHVVLYLGNFSCYLFTHSVLHSLLKSLSILQKCAQYGLVLTEKGLSSSENYYKSSPTHVALQQKLLTDRHIFDPLDCRDRMVKITDFFYEQQKFLLPSELAIVISSIVEYFLCDTEEAVASRTAVMKSFIHVIVTQRDVFSPDDLVKCLRALISADISHPTCFGVLFQRIHESSAKFEPSAAFALVDCGIIAMNYGNNGLQKACFDASRTVLRMLVSDVLEPEITSSPGDNFMPSRNLDQALGYDGNNRGGFLTNYAVSLLKALALACPDEPVADRFLSFIADNLSKLPSSALNAALQLIACKMNDKSKSRAGGSIGQRSFRFANGLAGVVDPKVLKTISDYCVEIALPSRVIYRTADTIIEVAGWLVRCGTRNDRLFAVLERRLSEKLLANNTNSSWDGSSDENVQMAANVTHLSSLGLASLCRAYLFARREDSLEIISAIVEQYTKPCMMSSIYQKKNTELRSRDVLAVVRMIALLFGPRAILKRDITEESAALKLRTLLLPTLQMFAMFVRPHGLTHSHIRSCTPHQYLTVMRIIVGSIPHLCLDEDNDPLSKIICEIVANIVLRLDDAIAEQRWPDIPFSTSVVCSLIQLGAYKSSNVTSKTECKNVAVIRDLLNRIYSGRDILISRQSLVKELHAVLDKEDAAEMNQVLYNYIKAIL